MMTKLNREQGTTSTFSWEEDHIIEIIDVNWGEALPHDTCSLGMEI